MNKKPTRIAVTVLVAVLSVLGVTQAGAAQGTVVADRQWCC